MDRARVLPIIYDTFLRFSSVPFLRNAHLLHGTHSHHVPPLASRDDYGCNRFCNVMYLQRPLHNKSTDDKRSPPIMS